MRIDKNSQITIYTKDSCSHCLSLKEELNILGLPFSEIKIGNEADITTEQFKEYFPDVKTVPLMFVDGECVGGYREFKERYKHQAISDLLRENVCKVKFIKVDGSERLMHCTLHKSFLPEMPLTEENVNSEPRKKNYETVRVFDLDKNDWRSFRIDSIITVSTAPIQQT